MSNFVEVEQADYKAFVNADHVALITPTKLIGETGLILINGVSLQIKGTMHEFLEKSKGNTGRFLEL
jgi:hypothetical protein